MCSTTPLLQVELIIGYCVTRNRYHVYPLLEEAAISWYVLSAIV